MNMLSLEHLIKENTSAIRAFDSDAEINAFLKNSSLQHIENLKTLKKKSIYTHELFALFVFDLNIDIDFKIYIADSVTYSSIEFSVTSFTSSLTLQLFVDYATSSYEREQSSTCFVEWTTSKKNRKNEEYDDVIIAKIIYQTTSNYKRKQIICFANSIEVVETNSNYEEKHWSKLSASRILLLLQISRLRNQKMSSSRSLLSRSLF